MSLRLTHLSQFLDHGHDAVIDVRSPSEFAEDRVPGAVNLPVLDDEERARIGTVYTQESPFLARKLGAALVARNAAAHIEGPLAGHDGGWRPLVYCWRGGQRSNSFASILAQIGWRVEVIDGGYRSYRRAVKRVLYDDAFPSPVVLLDGNTGTAKTELLARVRTKGGQTIDLEGLARHRGSVFGGTGDQPSQKAFESALAAEIAVLDPARPVLIEAESSKVGNLIVPPVLWSAMRAAPRIEIAAPVAARVAYLLEVYDDILADRDRLARLVGGLRRLQGSERVQEWLGHVARAEDALLAEGLIRHHYDPRYGRQRSRAASDPGDVPERLESPDLNPSSLDRLAGRIAAHLDRIAGTGG